MDSMPHLVSEYLTNQWTGGLLVMVPPLTPLSPKKRGEGEKSAPYSFKSNEYSFLAWIEMWVKMRHRPALSRGKRGDGHAVKQVVCEKLCMRA